MVSHKMMKPFTDKLQRSPFIWKLAVSLYGVRAFNPKRALYKKNEASLTGKDFRRRTYNLIFDAQCLQTPTRERGIGTYSLKFMEAVCRARPNDSFAAILTNIASTRDLAIAKSLVENLKCPNLDVLILNPFGKASKLSLIDAQESLLRDLESIRCRAIVVLSPFEKHSALITLPRSGKFKQVAILYDLIRLQLPDELLISNHQKSAFSWSLNNIIEFDLLLSISKETKRHWANLISPDTHIEVIHGGSNDERTDVYKNFEERTGILCVGAELPHKNLRRLIEAYSQLSEANQLRHSLTIVGIRSSGARKALLNFSRKSTGKVIIPNYLDALALTEIYKNSRLLVMPSLIEGLSLPILEAWNHGLVAVGSANTVAQELIGLESLLFDPYNVLSMADCMNRLITSEESWNDALMISTSRSLLFTWNSAASLALNAIEDVVRG